MSRTIVIGDVHGCLDEFEELVRLVEYDRNQDRLVLLGDLLDRGPDPLGCVWFARSIGAEMVLGNHEEKALRWRQYEQTRRDRPNPMRRPPPEREAQWLSLTEADLRWMRQLRTMTWLRPGTGLLPGLMLLDQPADKVIRVRWVNAAGEMVLLQKGSLDRPDGAFDWMDRWDGPSNVIYGHAVHGYEWPHVTRRADGVECIGLDTGCVYGGHLSAMVLDDAWAGRQFVRVKAKREYFARGSDHTE